jgi:uncharacterized C2H2 Zn-finger protein
VSRLRAAWQRLNAPRERGSVTMWGCPGCDSLYIRQRTADRHVSRAAQTGTHEPREQRRRARASRAAR